MDAQYDGEDADENFARKWEAKEFVDLLVEKTKIHRVKIVNKEPFCAIIPSEMLADCDTWTLEPFQKTCKKGHKIEYVEEFKNEQNP